jgi:hypothetical protein
MQSTAYQANAMTRLRDATRERRWILRSVDAPGSEARSTRSSWRSGAGAVSLKARPTAVTAACSCPDLCERDHEFD